MTTPGAAKLALMRENEKLREALRDAVNGSACWLPRAIELLEAPKPGGTWTGPGKGGQGMSHELTVDRVRARAATHWGYTVEQLSAPPLGGNRSSSNQSLSRAVWSCMAACSALGVPPRAIAHLFSADASTVARARKRTSDRAVARLTGLS